MKRALITGITGQDGSFLAELLLEKGYEVYGMIRRSSNLSTGRIEHLYREPHLPGTRLFLEYGDLADGSNLRHLISSIAPDEIYNLAAQSHVRVSFDQAEYTADVTGLGTLRLLEAIRDVGRQADKEIRFYQASSSEMFGASPPPQNEKTPFHPRSPYGVAKAFAFWQSVNHREAHGMHCSNGILFNHESERRGGNFVTRKITRAAGRIKVGLQEKLYLGNLEARRDWGYAKEYVEAMWLMLQQDKGDDYVIATGESHSVREFLGEVFAVLDLDWREHVEEDPYYFRASEVDALQGDASKAADKLGWRANVTFKELARTMTEHDLDLAEREAHAMKFKKGRQSPEP